MIYQTHRRNTKNNPLKIPINHPRCQKDCETKLSDFFCFEKSSQKKPCNKSNIAVFRDARCEE